MHGIRRRTKEGTYPTLNIAFKERKSNFDLWLSGVSCPVLGYVQKNSNSFKDTKMAIPLDFSWGMSRPVNWYLY